MYLFKVNNKNIRKRCKICLKLTIKTPERRQFSNQKLAKRLLCLSNEYNISCSTAITIIQAVQIFQMKILMTTTSLSDPPRYPIHTICTHTNQLL